MNESTSEKTDRPIQPSSLSPHPSVRVFCAIELPAHVRARAADHSSYLRSTIPEARASWDRPEKLHITLKFLGEIEQSRVEALSRAAARAAASVEAFDLAIEGTGAFPPRGLARVLWLGISDPTGRLARLQSRLEDECEREGFKREERPFHPHITIARLRAPAGARKFAALHEETGFEPMGFVASDLVIMRSELGPGGSRYSEISRHRLSGV
jgi:RNA 2',3'-cyclic 3'-phosphodiesterase